MAKASRLLALGLAMVLMLTTGSLAMPDDPLDTHEIEELDCMKVQLATPDDPIAISASHVGIDTCAGIGPGSPLVLRAGPLDLVYCTMAFILTDGTDLYVATAGHCVDPDLGAPGPGERVSAHGVAGTFGEVVYQWCEGGDSLGNGCGIGTDFGLIRVDADKHDAVHVEMCGGWGAPNGLFTEHDATPRLGQHYGWGMGLADPTTVIVLTGNPATQPREGIVVDTTDANSALFETVANSGDSGSGVLISELDTIGLPQTPRDGAQAMGVLTHVTNVGVFVQRLDISIEMAEAELGVDLEVVTA